MIVLTLAENEQRIKYSIDAAIPKDVQLALIDKYKTGISSILTECADLYRNPAQPGQTTSATYAAESANHAINMHEITSLYQLYDTISYADAFYNLPLACGGALETPAKTLYLK